MPVDRCSVMSKYLFPNGNERIGYSIIILYSLFHLCEDCVGTVWRRRSGMIVFKLVTNETRRCGSSGGRSSNVKVVVFFFR